MSGVVYIYGLKCPDTGLVRYVGKSENPKKRLYNHLCGRTSERLRGWISELSVTDKKPELVILEESDQDNWESVEKKWIESLSINGLLNAHEGGDLFKGKFIPGKSPKSNKKFSKKITIWIAQCLNGDKINSRVTRLTLKGLSEELGIPYSTAKVKRPVMEMKKVFFVVNNIVWDVWFEEIKR